MKTEKKIKVLLSNLISDYYKNENMGLGAFSNLLHYYTEEITAKIEEVSFNTEDQAGVKMIVVEWDDIIKIIHDLPRRLKDLAPTDEEINIQDEVAKIHHQYGISEMANYRIEQLFDRCMLERLTGLTKKDGAEEKKERVNIRRIIELKIQHQKQLRSKYIEAGNKNAQLVTDAKINILEDVIEDVDEEENDFFLLVKELAEWSKKYPRGKIYPMSKINMDDELIKIEEKAKKLIFE